MTASQQDSSQQEGPADGGAAGTPGVHDGGADGGADSGADSGAEDPADGGAAGTPGVHDGGACHTHSAKAGQGMNVSMQDGFILGWKLGYVLSGRSPESLLSTYSAERQVIAQNLIDFDKEWSTLMAKRPEEFADPAELADFYVRTAEFPTGFMTQYPPSMLVAEPVHQALAMGFPIGKSFWSAPVVRVADANPLHLGRQHRADGRWRVYAFADAAPGEMSALSNWAQWMAESSDSPIAAHTPEDLDVDSVLDVKVVYQPRRHGRDRRLLPSAPAGGEPPAGRGAA